MQAELDWKASREAVQAGVAAGDALGSLRAVRQLLTFEKPTDLSFSATALRKLGPQLAAAGHKALKVFIVRSVTVEPILPAFHVEAVLHGYALDLQVGGYGSFMDEMLDPGGALGRSKADLVFVLLDREDIAGQLPAVCARGRADEVRDEVGNSVARLSAMLHAFRESSSGRLVVSGCVLPYASSLGAVGDANLGHSLVQAVRDLNAGIAQACREVRDCAYFDADAVAGRFGRERFADLRMFLANRLQVAPAAFRAYAHGLLRTASALFRPPRKVLCTDLDNTFWGGILGEDGAAGLQTGPAFPGNCYLAYQQYLKELSARGILIAAVSKNNEADVAEAFEQRAADLAMTLSDFVARKIGWNDKAEALRELAAELSLGLDSFVFVDDNPVECEAIRQALPEVAVVEVPVTEPWTLVGVLADQWFFDVVSVTADDRNRSQEYKAQAQRAELNRSATSREEFLASLGIVCTFLSAADAPLDRSVQLLAKTNQFNLTTRRHSATEVMQFVEHPESVGLAVRVRDRFGDAGVVGLVLAERDGDTYRIDSLLLSCRVIGRGIESAILAAVADRARESGMRSLVGEYIETKKNVPCRDFYPEHGFARDPETGADGVIRYRLDLAEARPQTPSWLTVEGTGTYELAASAVVTA